MGVSGLDLVKVGDSAKFAKTVGEFDVSMFAGLTGDFSDTHINDQYMRERSNLGGRIAHGALLVGYMSTASTLSIAHIIHRDGLTDFPVGSGFDRVRFLKPVRLGDTVTTHYVVESVDRLAGKSIADIRVVNQHDEVVAVAKHIMRWAAKLQSAGQASG